MREPIDLMEACNKLKPYLGKKVDNLFFEYALAENDARRQEIYQIVLALYSKYIDSNFLDEEVVLRTPEEGVVNAEYHLGEIPYPNRPKQPFGLREKDWVRHVLISGMSGSGKTTFALRLIKNFVDRKKPFIVFDWKKSFRQLLNFSEDILIFTVGKPSVTNFFTININTPPKNVSPDEWITLICDLLCECYGASYGVHKLLTEVMQQAFKDFGVYSGSENYPTWYQIKQRLLDMEEDSKGKSRYSEWLTSAMRIVHSLTFGEFGKTINDKSKYNLSVEELLENQVVFELDSLGNIEKKLFCSFLLLYVYRMKKTNSGMDNNFTSSIIVDEAHNVFLKQRSNFVQESITDTIYREIREYGVGLVCLDQHISKLSDTVLGNSSTHIAFQQVLPQDVDCVSRLMFLWDKKDYFTKLQVGSAIVKLTERHYDPFKIDVTRLHCPNVYDDAALKELIKHQCVQRKRLKLFLDRLRPENLAKEVSKAQIQQDAEQALEPEKENAIIANHLQKDIYNQIIEVLNKSGTIKRAKKEFKKLGHNEQDIHQAFRAFKDRNPDVMKFIEEFTKHFSLNHLGKIGILEIQDFLQKMQNVGCNLSTTKLYEELNISIRKGNEIRNLLTELGIVQIHEEKTDRGLTKKIRFTPAGQDLMETLGTA